MRYLRIGILGSAVILSLLLISNVVAIVSAESVPDWIRNTAKWYGEGVISETEFLNAIKFLIENNIISLDVSENVVEKSSENPGKFEIIIPNGNFDIANAGFYIPLNAEVMRGTTVVWVNDDQVPHTVQSQDEKGQIIGLFNSLPLSTSERFAHTFDESGVYNYFCTLHPWRVGIVTVN